MQLNEQQLWQYIDNQLVEEERGQVERLIAESKVWRTAYREALHLQHQLQQMDTEAPSMRFTQNVMDNLPVKYGKVRGKNLLDRWGLSRWVLGSLAALVLMIVIAMISPAGTVAKTTYADSINGALLGVGYLIFGLVGGSVVILAGLDRWLKWYFQLKNPPAKVNI